MSETDKVFAGSVPENYDRYMVPLIFEPYAADIAERAASCRSRAELLRSSVRQWPSALKPVRLIQRAPRQELELRELAPANGLACKAAARAFRNIDRAT